MKTTVLIAGATGTNGIALVEALKPRKDITIRAMVRNLDKARSVLGDDVELVAADLSEPDSLKSAFEGVDKAYIVTAIQPNTIDLFSNFFDAAISAKVNHVVKYSGLGSSITSPSEVIRQHGTSDELLIESGLTYTILRPNSFHQNMLFQADVIRQTRKFYMPLGEAKQSIVDVRDIAEITANILLEEGHENQIYELTGPESLSFYQVADILTEKLNKHIEYIAVSTEDAEASMVNAGMPVWDAHVLAEVQALFATGHYADVLPDTKKLLKREPTTFAQFVETHAKLFA